MAKLLCFICNQVWIVRGEEKNSGKPLTMVFYGASADKYYYQNHFFGANASQTELGKTYFWQLNSIAKSYPDCLTIIGGNMFTRIFLKRKKDFFVPMWIKGVHDLPLDVTKYESAPLYRTIKKNNLTYSVSDKKQDLDFFIKTMYFPYIANRYGDECKALTVKTIMRTLSTRPHKVMFVMQNGEPIAGMLHVYFKSMPPFIWLLGVKDGDFTHVKSGAVSAAYYYSAECFMNEGYQQMWSGGTRPFLKDGLLVYKRKWGFQLASKSLGCFLIKPNGHSEAKEALFCKNPLIYIDKCKMRGAHFIKDQQNTIPVINKKLKQFNGMGVTDVSFFHIDADLWLTPVERPELKPVVNAQSHRQRKVVQPVNFSLGN